LRSPEDREREQFRVKATVAGPPYFTMYEFLNKKEDYFGR